MEIGVVRWKRRLSDVARHTLQVTSKWLDPRTVVEAKARVANPRLPQLAL